MFFVWQGRRVMAIHYKPDITRNINTDRWKTGRDLRPVAFSPFSVVQHKPKSSWFFNILQQASSGKLLFPGLMHG